jgi:hypothetical protein
MFFAFPSIFPNGGDAPNKVNAGRTRNQTETDGTTVMEINRDGTQTETFEKSAFVFKLQVNLIIVKKSCFTLFHLLLPTSVICIREEKL